MIHRGMGGLKTESLPLLRSGSLPFTRPRAAMVFKPPMPRWIDIPI